MYFGEQPTILQGHLADSLGGSEGVLRGFVWIGLGLPSIKIRSSCLECLFRERNAFGLFRLVSDLMQMLEDRSSHHCRR